MDEDTTVKLQLAEQKDMVWVNEWYKSIQFVPASLDEGDKIVIALCNGERAGLGRLVPIDDVSWELGGIYVQDEFRGKGIARRIVQRLCDIGKEANTTLWCIPFAHLVPFYTSFGFEAFPKCSKDIPCKIQCKIGNCNSTFPDKNVALLKMATPGDES